MRVCIAQPECYPWLGFFDKLARVDLAVMLDDAMFKKNYFENRNRVRIKTGTCWLTVPVRRANRERQRLCDVQIANDSAWPRRHLRTLEHAYARSRHYKRHRAELEGILGQRWDLLVEFNITVITWLAEALGVTPPQGFVRSSDLDLSQSSTARLVQLCRSVGADTYLSGISGREYLDERQFRDARIRVEFQEFFHPIYAQTCRQFVAGLSTLDLMFEHGGEAGTILREAPYGRLETLFD